MNANNYRRLHALAGCLGLIGCTVEHVDLGGIDAIGGQRPVSSTDDTSAGSTVGDGIAPTESGQTCIAYNSAGEASTIPCDEAEWATQHGYCVLRLDGSTAVGTVCPTEPEVDPTTTRSGETCAYVVSDGTTVGIACGSPATDVGCSTSDSAGSTAGTVPCGGTTSDVLGPTCGVETSNGGWVTVPCGSTGDAPATSTDAPTSGVSGTESAPTTASSTGGVSGTEIAPTTASSTSGVSGTEIAPTTASSTSGTGVGPTTAPPPCPDSSDPACTSDPAIPTGETLDMSDAGAAP